MLQQFQISELCQNPRMIRFEKIFFTEGNFLNRKAIIELNKSSCFSEHASI